MPRSTVTDQPRPVVVIEVFAGVAEETFSRYGEGQPITYILDHDNARHQRNLEPKSNPRDLYGTTLPADVEADYTKYNRRSPYRE